MDEVEIYTDGACKGNPGPGGWGALLRVHTSNGERTKELCGGELNTTNNRMELLSVIRALEALKRRCKIKIYTDSVYVQKGMTEWIQGWKQRGWKTASREPVKNVDLWQQLDDLASQHEIQWYWVKGHAGHPENEIADQLANRGVELLLKRSLSESE